MIKITHWCIRRTPETASKINAWFKTKYRKGFSAKTDFQPGWGAQKSFWRYLHYPDYKGKTLWDKKMRGYTEITFDEFKKYILRKQIKLLKEKSGYQDYVYIPDPPKKEIKKDDKNKIPKQKQTSKKISLSGDK